MKTITLLFVGVYIIVIFLLSAFFVKRALNSYMEYSFCGRSLTFFFVFFTYLGTWIGGGTIIGLAEKSYMNGANQYWMFGISCLAGFIFVFLFMTRIRKLQVFGISDMLALRFPDHGEIIRIPTAIGLIIRNVTVIGMHFVAMSYMFMFATGIDENLATLITLTVVIIYTTLSGFWGVVITDVLQGIMQSVGMFLLLYFILKFSGGINGIFKYYENSGLESFLSLTGGTFDLTQFTTYILVFGLFFLMGDQSDWERIYSCKTDKTSFWGFLIPLSVTLLLLLLPTYMGVFLKSIVHDSIPTNYILYWFSYNMLPEAITVFLMLTIISSVLSSTDSFMVASGVIFSSDIIKKFINANANDRELIFWSRIAVIIAGAIGFAFAINMLDIFYLWTIGIGISTIIIIPAYFLAWFSKRASTIGVISGMIVGILYSIVIMFSNLDFTPMSIIFGILINVLFTFIISILTKAPEKQEIGNTYYWSEKFAGIKNIPK